MSKFTTEPNKQPPGLRSDREVKGSAILRLVDGYGKRELRCVARRVAYRDAKCRGERNVDAGNR